jgi:cytochrome c oxidase subunit 2
MWRLAPLIGVLAFILTGCGDPTLSALTPKGPVARDQMFLMILSLSVMIFVFVVVMAIYIYVLVRYRRRKGDNKIPKQVEGNHKLEILWTVIPIILLIIIAVPSITQTFDQARDMRKEKDAIHVNVIGHQFWWQFEYPDLGITTAQDLVIPTGKYVSFDVVSADTNHSFWIPVLGGKIDANRGIHNVFYLKSDEVGIFKGKCAELCGASHALMDFKVNSMSPTEFDAWVNKMKAPPAAVPATAAKGEQIFKDNCMSCHATGVNDKSFGPNLNGFASRTLIAGILEHNDANLKRWINDPLAEKPGATMPKVGLNDDQLNEVIKYLDTLK